MKTCPTYQRVFVLRLLALANSPANSSNVSFPCQILRLTEGQRGRCLWAPVRFNPFTLPSLLSCRSHFSTPNLIHPLFFHFIDPSVSIHPSIVPSIHSPCSSLGPPWRQTRHRLDPPPPFPHRQRVCSGIRSGFVLLRKEGIYQSLICRCIHGEKGTWPAWGCMADAHTASGLNRLNAKGWLEYPPSSNHQPPHTHMCTAGSQTQPNSPCGSAGGVSTASSTCPLPSRAHTGVFSALLRFCLCSQDGPAPWLAGSCVGHGSGFFPRWRPLWFDKFCFPCCRRACQVTPAMGGSCSQAAHKTPAAYERLFAQHPPPFPDICTDTNGFKHANPHCTLNTFSNQPDFSELAFLHHSEKSWI